MTVLFCDGDVVTLPDGKTVELNDNVTVCDVAADIGLVLFGDTVVM